MVEAMFGREKCYLCGRRVVIVDGKRVHKDDGSAAHAPSKPTGMLGAEDDYLRRLSNSEIRELLENNPLDPNDGGWALVAAEAKRRGVSRG